MNRLKYCIFALIFSSLQPLPAFLDIPFAASAGLAYDYFRSVPEGDFDGNIGGLWDVNIGMRAPYLDCYNVGLQLGGSYGVYDWSGRTSNVTGNPREVQQQGFLTAALTIENPMDTGIQGAIAFDWMINKNFGVFALPCGLSQFRFQGGYLWDCNEFGVLGTVNTHTCHRHVIDVPVSFRAISQVSLYWQSYFENCARTMIWVGLPYNKSLRYSHGRSGKFVIGANFDVPLTNNIYIVGHAMYMRGHSAESPGQTLNNAANICIGLNYRFGSSCEATVPYLSIGNNSNFIVDTSETY